LRRVIFAIVATAAALVVLLSFKTHTSPAIASSAGGSGSAASGGGAPAGGRSTAAGTSRSRGKSPRNTGGTAKTATGSVADTAYGPVQVQVTVKGGKVTAAEATQYPSGTPRDAQINSYAIPVLNQEAVSASSARIDAVSGATYTSEGYISSLQSALNKAGL
jgi:uncharacterized protein with FMN-binding domain